MSEYYQIVYYRGVVQAVCTGSEKAYAIASSPALTPGARVVTVSPNQLIDWATVTEEAFGPAEMDDTSVQYFNKWGSVWIPLKPCQRGHPRVTPSDVRTHRNSKGYLNHSCDSCVRENQRNRSKRERVKREASKAGAL